MNEDKQLQRRTFLAYLDATNGTDTYDPSLITIGCVRKKEYLVLPEEHDGRISNWVRSWERRTYIRHFDKKTWQEFTP